MTWGHNSGPSLVWNPIPKVTVRSQIVKNLPAMQETQVQSLGQEDSLGEENGYSLQYCCLENSMDRGAWWAIVHGVAKSQTWLSDQHTHTQSLREVSLLHSKCLFGLKQGLQWRLWLETHNFWEEGTALLSLILYLSKYLSQHIIMIFFSIFVLWSFTDD